VPEQQLTQEERDRLAEIMRPKQRIPLPEGQMQPATQPILDMARQAMVPTGEKPVEALQPPQQRPKPRKPKKSREDVLVDLLSKLRTDPMPMQAGEGMVPFNQLPDEVTGTYQGKEAPIGFEVQKLSPAELQMLQQLIQIQNARVRQRLPQE